MPPANAPEVILGLANVGDASADPLVRFGTPEAAKQLLDAFFNRGYSALDTARKYSPHAPGTSEPIIGVALQAYGSNPPPFSISTKVLPDGEHSHTREKIEENVTASLTALKLSQVDIEYLHQPDHTTPLEETCEAIDKAYREGKFRRFGLSNHAPDDVEKVVAICEERGFVKPTVYQGHYNAIAREPEKALVPVLRKHGIAYHAFSPAAAGMFSGNHKNTAPGNRYDTNLAIGKIYTRWYIRPSVIAAVEAAVEIASKHGISGHAGAIRWVAYHSVLDAKYGDGIVVGASRVEQLEQNLDVFEQGPLPQEVADAYSSVFSQLE